MPAHDATPITDPINQETIERLVREVLRRLTPASRPASAEAAHDAPPPTPPPTPTPTPPPSPTPLSDRVITAAVVANVAINEPHINIDPRAIVTPAAKDEARRRNMTIRRTAPTTNQTTTHPTSTNQTATVSSTVTIHDRLDPQRGEAVAAQLIRRGLGMPSSKIMLSETPGRDVYEQCSQYGQRAVMVTALADVDRYLIELKPTCWVLDMTRLNLVAAVNVLARIAQREVTY